MMNIINWVMEHSSELLGILTSVVAAASAIAALTPTPKDDGLVKRVYGLLDILALNVGKAKDK
tara:strand:+ start:712 stop:900 length:189 start_codon:yes stop_codon:yes gene_type:complete